MKNQLIKIDSSVLFGKPYIAGTRVSVEQVLAALAEGMSAEELMDEFGVSDDAIKACMEYAYKSVSRTHIISEDTKSYA